MEAQAQKQLSEVQTNTGHTLKLGDYVIFLAKPTSDITSSGIMGKIQQLYETSQGRKFAKVARFYFPEQLPGGRKLYHAPREVFETNRLDTVDIEATSWKPCIIEPKEQFRIRGPLKITSHHYFTQEFYDVRTGCFLPLLTTPREALPPLEEHTETSDTAVVPTEGQQLLSVTELTAPSKRKLPESLDTLEENKQPSSKRRRLAKKSTSQRTETSLYLDSDHTIPTEDVAIVKDTSDSEFKETAAQPTAEDKESYSKLDTTEGTHTLTRTPPTKAHARWSYGNQNVTVRVPLIIETTPSVFAIPSDTPQPTPSSGSRLARRTKDRHLVRGLESNTLSAAAQSKDNTKPAPPTAPPPKMELRSSIESDVGVEEDLAEQKEEEEESAEQRRLKRLHKKARDQPTKQDRLNRLSALLKKKGSSLKTARTAVEPFAQHEELEQDEEADENEDDFIVEDNEVEEYSETGEEEEVEEVDADEEEEEDEEEDEGEQAFGERRGASLLPEGIRGLVLKDAFTIYIQYLVSCYLDAEFHEATRKTPYFRNAVAKVESALIGRKESLLRSTAWQSGFRESLEALPFFKSDVLHGDSICQACQRSGHPASYEVTLYGPKYYRNTPFTFPTKKTEQHSYSLGRFCKSRTELFHRLHHYKFHLCRKIEKQVSTITAKKADEVVKEALANKQWIKERWVELKELLNQAESYAIRPE